VRIDIHAHYYPPKFTTNYGRETTAGRNALTSPGGKVTLEERVDMLKEAGVDLQVLCVGAQQPDFPNAEEATAVAKWANDFYTDISRGYDGRFAAFGATPMPHVDAAIDEVGRCLETLGMVGINTGTSIAGRPLDDPEFAPFFAELDRRQAVLFLHPLGVGGPNMDAYGLDFMVGVCCEDTVAAVRLVMSGLAAKYPNIKIIVPHLGGTMPFLMQRVNHAVGRQMRAGVIPAVERPSDAVRAFYWDTVNGYGPALRLACESFGSDHIMLGTDFPFILVNECVEYVQRSGLPADEIEAILERTAQRVLALP
jgi:predicted TIM-barrel fold metal-dependent hydrolase